MDNQQVAERYGQAEVDHDLATMAELVHDDIIVVYPQSGEMIRGKTKYLDMLANYPEGIPVLEVEDRHSPQRQDVLVKTSPFGMPVITVSGEGNLFFTEGLATYADGSVFNVAGILEIHDGKVTRETMYFAAPFAPPSWRERYVEH